MQCYVIHNPFIEKESKLIGQEPWNRSGVARFGEDHPFPHRDSPMDTRLGMYHVFFFLGITPLTNRNQDGRDPIFVTALASRCFSQCLGWPGTASSYFLQVPKSFRLRCIVSPHSSLFLNQDTAVCVLLAFFRAVGIDRWLFVYVTCPICLLHSLMW